MENFRFHKARLGGPGQRALESAAGVAFSLRSVLRLNLATCQDGLFNDEVDPLDLRFGICSAYIVIALHVAFLDGDFFE